MTDLAHSIEIQNLSKRYRIGRLQPGRTFREDIVEFVKRPFGRRTDEADSIWALRNVSFDVGEGEVVGIIGKNGAGKSTLLRVLSKITYPTEGNIKVKGRVASLLEVGTGFHEELTGRENVYLNGSILGMRKRQVDERFDAIVAFSGVEQFIDTQIKRYSSGMRLRLGFAVAAHLEPDVLIVDEVLAVGDAGFQKKCLDAMEGLRSGDKLIIRFHYHAKKTVRYPSFGFRIFTNMGTLITETGNVVHGVDVPRVEPGNGYIDVEIESLNLLPAQYYLSLWITELGGM